MRKDIKTTEAIFPMPVLMVATYNEDGSVSYHVQLGTSSHKVDIRLFQTGGWSNAPAPGSSCGMRKPVQSGNSPRCYIC